jgi:hypothetical protein
MTKWLFPHRSDIISADLGLTSAFHIEYAKGYNEIPRIKEMPPKYK